MTIAIPTVFDVLSLAGRVVPGRWRHQVDAAGAIRQEAEDLYEEVVGRFDVSSRIPSRELVNVITDEDKEDVKDLGAIYNEHTQRWIVPESIQGPAFERFSFWWPETPADLRDTTPRHLMTKSGRRYESMVLAQDRGKGGDSTATSFMFGALPALAAFIFLTATAGGGWLLLTLVAMALTIPYLVTLKQGEGLGATLKAFVLTFVLPLLFASGQSFVPDMKGNTLSMLFAGMAVMAFGAIGLVVCAVQSLTDVHKGFWLGFTERAKAMVAWTVAAAVLGAICLVLPGDMGAFLGFGLASLYPMVYTEREALERAAKLWQQGEKYNLGTQGALANTHVSARVRQAEAALLDKSPLINFGQATGWLTRKHYGMAPDAGMPMVLSELDLTMHLLFFGESGIGKTSTGLIPAFLQHRLYGYGGTLVTDGKMALAGELRKWLDLIVESGIRFAPFQGLDAQQLCIAINSVSGEFDRNDKNAVWESGARDYMDHVTVVHEALKDHELAMRQHAIQESRRLEVLIDDLACRRADAMANGDDVSSIEASLADLSDRLSRWSDEAERDRAWFWTPATLDKLLSLANEPRKVGEEWVAGSAFQELALWLGFDPGEIKGLSQDAGLAVDYSSRVATQPNSIHPDIGMPGSLLSASLDYLLNKWPGMEPEHRNSFMLNVRAKVGVLLRGKHLRDNNGIPWHSTEEGVDVSIALYGKHVGVCLPTAVHGDAGLLIGALVTQRVYSGIQKRALVDPAVWKAEGQRPMWDLKDECQLIVSKVERDLLPIARSLGMACVYATQNYEGLVAKFKDVWSARQFVYSFLSIMCYRSTNETYALMAERLGSALLTTFESPTTGLDYEAGFSNLLNSPLNDLNHPNAVFMSHFERMGGGQMMALDQPPGSSMRWHGPKAQAEIDAETSKVVRVPSGGKREVQPLFKPEEFSSLLAGKGDAIAYFNRAGVRRVDLIKVSKPGAFQDMVPPAEPEVEEAA